MKFNDETCEFDFRLEEEMPKAENGKTTQILSTVQCLVNVLKLLQAF